MLIPLSLIGLFPDAQAQTVTANVTGDPFTIGEGNSTLNVYESADNFVDTDNSILQRSLAGPYSSNVDSSERLLFSAPFGGIQYMFIDLDTTLGELPQTINPGGFFFSQFSYNFTSLTTQNGTTSIYLAVFDDDVVTNNRIGAGTTILLAGNRNPQENVPVFRGLPIFNSLTNSTLADKNIGYIIEFNNRVTFSGEQPISLDFESFRPDRTPINHITRTWDYSIQIPPGLTPAQQITYQNLVNVITARQAAIDQQNVIVDYWNDSNNPSADDRELAQARIDYANSHITQSTIQRDSYQAQLDQLTS